MTPPPTLSPSPRRPLPRHARRGMLARLGAWLAGLVLLLQPAAATAKVYQAPEAGLRLHIALHDVADERARPLERLTRQALDDVQDKLRTRLSGDLNVDFVGSPGAFAEVLAREGGHAPEAWIAGLALLGRDRIIVEVNGPGALLTSEVVRHELAHIALHALSGDRWLPRWYHEGVSMWLAGEATFERLRDSAGAAALGQLDSLEALNRGFSGHQAGVERAYAMAAGFIRFAVHRTGDRATIGQLHERMRAGLDFPAAFTATFGQRPEALYELYSAHVGTHASRWSLVLSDSAVWALVSILALWALWIGWRNRPRFEDDGEPMDLEAIAAAGEAALRRPWHLRDFMADPLRAGDDEPDAADDLGPPPIARPWHLRDFTREPLRVDDGDAVAAADVAADVEEAAAASIDSQNDRRV